MGSMKLGGCEKMRSQKWQLPEWQCSTKNEKMGFKRMGIFCPKDYSRVEWTFFISSDTSTA